MEREKMSLEGQQLEENQQLLPLQHLVEAENPHREILKCPRCESENTKFMYYNNYSTSQPRHYCRHCKRSWTKGGTLRNVPFGGTQRRKRCRTSLSSSGATSDTLFIAPPPPLPALVEVPIQPVYTFTSLPTRSIFGDGRLMTAPTSSFNQPPPLDMAGGYNNIGLPNPFIRTPQAQTGPVQLMGPAYQTLSAANHQQTHRLRSSGIGPFFNGTTVNDPNFITNPNSVWSNNNSGNGALGSFTDPNQISGFYGR